MSAVAAPSTRRQLVLAVATVIVTVVVTAWLWQVGQEQSRSAATTGSQEAEAAVTGPPCDALIREPTGDAGAHVDGPIDYASAPPAFGDHRGRWEVRALSFYDVDARPDVPVLVHNLEHGYNILWYDQTVVDDAAALARVEEIAAEYATLDGGRDPDLAFIAAPWTAADGESFPEGMDYAFTHWYADPTDRTRSRSDEVGLTQYCSAITPELVQQWMDNYPLKDAPEGYPDLM